MAHKTNPRAHLEEYIAQKRAVLSTSVSLSTWIVYYGDSLILFNNCASTSFIISSIHLMVLTKRETSADFF